MSEDTLQRQINELNDKVAAMAVVIDDQQKTIQSVNETIGIHTEVLRVLNASVDALMARIAE